MDEFNGVKTFTATKSRERESLGDQATKWIREHPDVKIVDKIVTQSSDNEYHCLTITFFYFNENLGSAKRKK